ncbi:MAG: aminodeoxychorismate/anthranilate synthase component II [Planctomycetota bacterium]|nr:MAG: aminodeoxychorismate/anthranilate synthase component II [Planctomycetota bacterium]
MILLIDNYDSFTWNLVQRIGEMDPAAPLRVVRNDELTAGEIEALDPGWIILSPGPGTPDDAGVCCDVIRRLGGRVPILGVCLGHQCIGAVHGMTVARHQVIMHGKTSPIRHDGTGVFAGLPNPFIATRYHSLIVTGDSVPAEGWAVSARTTDRLDTGEEVEVVMGLRREWPDPAAAPLEGVQFHPESFLTGEGSAILANFLGLRADGRVAEALASARAQAEGSPCR